MPPWQILQIVGNPRTQVPGRRRMVGRSFWEIDRGFGRKVLARLKTGLDKSVVKNRYAMSQQLADEECRVEDGLFVCAPMPPPMDGEKLDPGMELSVLPLQFLTGPEPSPDLVDRTMQRVQSSMAARQHQ